MEVIHRYVEGYPFGLEKENQFTFVEVLRGCLTEEQIHRYKLKGKIFREMGGQYVLRLVRLLREQNSLLFLFEYYPCSIRCYLQYLRDVCEVKWQQKVHVGLVDTFLQNMNGIIELLVHYQIKTDLLLTNLVVPQFKGNSFRLKIFVEPDVQCYALQIHFAEKNHQELKRIIQENKEKLKEFYGNQRKKILIQFEELLEQVSGKKEGKEELHPNFVINGSKLVFNSIQPRLDSQNKGSFSANNMECLGEICQDSKQLHVIHKKQIKERNEKKIKQIKQKLNKLQSHKQQNITSVYRTEKMGELEDNSEASDKIGHNLCDQQLNKINHSKQLKKERKKSRQIRSGSPLYKDLNGNNKPNVTKQQVMKNSNLCQNHEQNVQKYKMKIKTTHDIQVEEANEPNKANNKEVVYQISTNNQQEGLIDSQLSKHQQMQHKYGKLLDVILNRNGEMNGRRGDRVEEEDNKNRKGSASLISTFQKERNIVEKHVSNEHEGLKRQQNEGSTSNFYDKVQLAKSKAEKVLKQHRKSRKQ